MIVWIDAQLSPALAPWLNQAFGVPAYSTRHLGLQFAKDREIFLAAREGEHLQHLSEVDPLQELCQGS